MVSFYRLIVAHRISAERVLNLEDIGTSYNAFHKQSVGIVCQNQRYQRT